MRLERITQNPAVVTTNISQQQGGPAPQGRQKDEKSPLESDPRSVEQTVDRMNEMIKLKHEDKNVVELQIDEANRLVVKVINRQTGEVVDQFPSERLLKVMQSMDELLGTLLDQKA